MLQFARLIRKIERLQKGHPLFFLVENVVTRREDRQAITDSFGFDWDPVTFDAASVSPCRRERQFFSNIPPELNGFSFTGETSESQPSTCIEQGFRVSCRKVRKSPCNSVSTHC